MISFPAILLRLGLALVLGAIIGAERESSEHSAGLRTNALVALGASLFTVVSGYGFADLIGMAHVQLDPSRIASYVVAGIGFLGAGTIFLQRDKEKVKGLTTAATIWIVAAIGLACGSGLLLEAVAGTIMALIVLVLLRYVERILLLRRTSAEHRLHIETTSLADSFIDHVYEACGHSGVTIEALGIRSEQGIDTIKVTCHISDPAALGRLVSELKTLPGVRAVYGDIDSTDTENKTTLKSMMHKET